MNLNSKQTLLNHRILIRKKAMLSLLYKDFYLELIHAIDSRYPIVELGSGGGFLKDMFPTVITSDIMKGPQIDRVIRAEQLPFKKNSIGAFIMLNTFHHIKDSQTALSQMQRSLKKGGKIVMVEPWKTAWSSFIYTYFHHEQFNTHASWFISGKGRMSDANGALPWIVFSRDRYEFKTRYPYLKIQRVRIHTPFRYLLSGGLSRPQLVPTILYPLLTKIDSLLSSMGMFATIEIKKL